LELLCVGYYWEQPSVFTVGTFRFGSLAAPEGQASPVSASRRIAELPWI
jgi:hypothetical protein